MRTSMWSAKSTLTTFLREVSGTSLLDVFHLNWGSTPLIKQKVFFFVFHTHTHTQVHSSHRETAHKSSDRAENNAFKNQNKNFCLKTQRRSALARLWRVSMLVLLYVFWCVQYISVYSKYVGAKRDKLNRWVKN